MQKYYILTYGCQMNKSNSERIASSLEKNGYQPTLSESEADLVVINMCSVRQRAVEKVKSQISRLRPAPPEAIKSKQGFRLRSLSFGGRVGGQAKIKKPKIFLTGCVLQSDKKAFKKMGIEIREFRNLEKIRPKASFVPIMEGCNNFCSYCVVPYTRGREKCRPPEEIICEVKHLIKRGLGEITLLGQNVNSYRSNIKNQNAKLLENKKQIDFADLLEIINSLPGDFKIRFLTNHPKDITDKLIETIARCKKIEEYIHLPVQSGDDEILRKMNRGYTRQQYLTLVEKIRDKIHNVELTTDIIVGFPGETKKQFQNTLNLVKKVGFKTAYIAMYSPRPGTAAYKLKDNVPLEEKKRRHKILLQEVKR